MSFIIRKAKYADAEQIYQLIKQLAPLFLDNYNFDTLEHFKCYKIAELIQNEEFEYLLAQNDKELIGVIALKKLSHLYHLFIAEKFQKQGYSRLLWNYLMGQYFANSSEIAHVTVNASLNSVTVYERLGFHRLEQAVQVFNGMQFVPMQYQIFQSHTV
ncbi:GNAT family N-acetyltransferase [Acinetobacter silvestris]|uniref:N-acetyltransferase domain-containing protein n=1 Tax=Acinetobacter silvestris TaxID=1977882 RepID=A0A1Y3CJ26_9GAMM|nr:GNAT family N-acetyltransferase [Acinetobacter silvestris]OTG66434.1 hypothetical protein B9T28_04045 [Acinetobacter silvestris]